MSRKLQSIFLYARNRWQPFNLGTLATIISVGEPNLKTYPRRKTGPIYVIIFNSDFTLSSNYNQLREN